MPDQTPCQYGIDTRENLDRYMDRMNGTLDKIWAKLDRPPAWVTVVIALLTAISGWAISKLF